MSIFNVQEYGARGDGATDDTVSIQHAINAAAGTFIPGNGLGSPLTIPPRDLWARLNMFLSRDILSERYRKKHGRSLSVEKAKEIISSLSQARDYFQSAADAAPLVRPLLQYYGVLGFARAHILLAKPSLRETSLAQAHGLATSIGGADDFAEMKLTVTKGTFMQFLDATRNLQVTPVWSPPSCRDRRTTGFPKKGTRRMVVSGGPFRWTVAVDEDWMTRCHRPRPTVTPSLLSRPINPADI